MISIIVLAGGLAVSGNLKQKKPANRLATKANASQNDWLFAFSALYIAFWACSRIEYHLNLAPMLCVGAKPGRSASPQL